MDDLRWVLLLAGVVVVVAIYFSGRFEGEDWARERKQFREGKKASGKNKQGKKILSRQSAPVARPVVKKEPSISSVPEAEMDTPVVIAPDEQVPDEQVLVKQETFVQKDASAQEVPPVQEEAPAHEEAPVQEETPDQEETSLHKEASAQQNIVKPSSGSVREAAMIEGAAQATATDEIDSSKPAEEKDDGLTSDEMIELDIEDEITEVEIPMDLAVAEASIHIDDLEQKEKPEQAEISLDIEPLVLSISVLADGADGFNGQELIEALEAEGLAYGAMRIFHFYDPGKEDVVDSDDAVFSAANLLEPGYFDLDKLDDMHTPGLMLFCQLPGPIEGVAALELMLDKGRGLAVRLHGQMCDDKRNVFTTQAKTYYLDKIATFNREVELARKKAKA